MFAPLRLPPLAFTRAGFAGLTGLVFILLLTLGGSSAAAEPLSTLVVVHDGTGLLAAGAEVYRNCVFAGTTDGSGQITLPVAVSGDHIEARLLTYTAPTAKGSHASWAFHVWRTNIRQFSDGSQRDDVITAPGGTNNVYLDIEANQIGYCWRIH